jgi:DHA2 family multidrug resistance protein
MGIVLGPTLGPTLGGYLIENYSWPLIFMVNIPVGIVATILSITFIEKKEGEGKKKKEMHIDYTGIILLALGIGCLQFVLERGETEDWFSSNYSRVASVIATIGIVSFIIYELNIQSPAVNLRLLGNRNLAFTTIFTFIVGLGLFTSVFVYPVLAQRVLGFTAYETGVALLPPTLFTVLLLPIVGKLMSKGASPLPFVIAGFVLFASFCFTAAGISPDVGKWDFFLPISLRALGMGMVQLPLINQAVAGLELKDYASGISLNNMVRQLGGASGIALANNYVAHRYAQHRSDLVSHLPNGSPQLMERINAVSQYITTKTGDVVSIANAKAVGLINASVDRQAYYLSYLDTFRLIGLFFIVSLPLVVFLRTKKKSSPEMAMKAAAEAH